MQLTVLSRCFDPNDYELLESEIGLLEHTKALLNLSGTNYRFEHHHRMWEYAMFLRATFESPMSHSVLDVGGGGSLLAPTLCILPFNVTVVDPQPIGNMLDSQMRSINATMLFAQRDFMSYTGGVFDLIACVSVIEHVVNDVAFFEKLLRHVRGRGGILFLTTDFHESGEQQTLHHLRTYNEKSLMALLDIATLEGFEPLGGGPDWSSKGHHINGYNFCSMALVQTM